MAIKNQQITITYNSWSADTGLAITGDVANHTCRLSQDGGAFATATNSPAELGYGVYKLTLTATETNCAALTLQVSSSTSGVVCPPVQITFDAAISAPTAADVADAVWMYNPSDADYAGTSSLAWHLDVIRQRMIELPIASEIGTAVWNTDLGPYPSSGTFAGTALNVARSAASSAAGCTYPTLAQITAGVWNSIIMVDGTTTASAKEQINTICSAVNAIRYADIANAVWSATTRTITGGMLTTEPPTVAQIQSGLATSAEISALSIPTASAIADAVCDEALSGHTTAGTLGKVISDTATATTATAISTAVGEIDTAVDTINTTVAAMQQTVLTINSNVQAISGYTDELEDMVQDLPTSSAIADTVWGRTTGSTQRTITNTIPTPPTVAEIAMEVWSNQTRTITNLPTDYSKLTAADIPTVAQIQSGLSTLTTADIPTPPTVAEIQSGLAKTSELPTDYATSLALSQVKTVVDAIPTATYTIPTVAQIQSGLAKTVDIPTDYSKLTAADIPTVAAIQSGLATSQQATDIKTVVDAIPTATYTIPTDYAKATDLTTANSNISAIKTKTDTLTNTDVTGLATTAQLTAAKDAIISRGNAAWTTADVSGLTVDLTGVATAQNVTDAKDAILSRGNAAWTTATGFATPSDIPDDYTKTTDIPTSDITAIKNKVNSLNNTDISTLAKTSELPDISGLATREQLNNLNIPTVLEIQSGLVKTSDIPTDYAKTTDVSALSIPTVSQITDGVWSAILSEHVGTGTTGKKLNDITLPPTATKIATAVWAADSRTLTSSGSGGATAAEVWAYSARTLTSSPTDISGLATQASVNSLAAAVEAIPTDPVDTSTLATSAQIDALVIPTVSDIQSGLAKTTDLSGLSTLTAADIPTPPTVAAIQSGLATSAGLSALQDHGDAHWGVSTDGGITVSIDAAEIADAVWSADERTLTSAPASTLTAQDVWEYGNRTLTPITDPTDDPDNEDGDGEYTRREII